MHDSEEARILFRPVSEASARAWNVVGDPVMGGISIGSIRFVEKSPGGALVFEGQVRSDFGGGFASFELPLDPGCFRGANGIELDMEGPAQSWRIRVKEHGMQRGEAWQAPYQLKDNKRTRLRIPFKDFVRSIRGRRLENPEPMQTDHIDRIGLLIADRQFGPFRLTLHGIRTY